MNKAILVLGSLFVGSALYADEGMWTFDNLPVQQLKNKYGFEVTAEWKEQMQKAAVRVSTGGTGEFISSNGLALTNHHVAGPVLQGLSKPGGRDYLATGYLAKTQAEELKYDNLELNQLIDIVDVTEKVNAAVKPEMNADTANTARKAVIAQIEKESEAETKLFSQVVTLYNGGQYHLYRYKRYTDLRLVFAPEKAIAFFGGDVDNFEFPRYDLDMAIFRAYEDGKPAVIKNFLRKPTEELKQGDLVFVTGNPGKTNRLLTVAALQFLKNVSVPYTLDVLIRRENTLQQFANRSAENKRRAGDLFGVQNSRKAYVGKRGALQNPALITSKRTAENELRSRVRSDLSLSRYANAWETIENSRKAYGKIYIPYVLFEGAYGFNSRLFGIARTLVRVAEENAKPNGERLDEYQDSKRKPLERALFSDEEIYSDVERVTLQDSLAMFQEHLARVKKQYRYNETQEVVMGGKSPEARAAELVDGSKLADVAERKRLYEGGKAALDQSKDPMILLAKAVDAVSRSLRKKVETEVSEVERVAYAKIAEAKYKVYGVGAYPDATFSLRVSYGTVDGHPVGNEAVPAFTTMGGAFEHSKAHAKDGPDFELPQSWHDAKEKGALDLSTPFNFLSTADIIGGNSGSSVVNRKGEQVGLIFDGNIYSLGGDFYYDPVQNRAVSVDIQGMLHSLEKIYDAKALAEEWGR